MKRILLIAGAVALGGCTVDNSDNCGYQHDLSTEYNDQYGLTVKPGQMMYATPEQITQYYAETMACMGMSPADGPTVQYVSYDTYFNGAYGSPWAGYISPGLVFVNTNELSGPGFQRDCRIDMEALKHEFIHYILDVETGNKSHGGENQAMFEKCGLGVNTYN